MRPRVGELLWVAKSRRKLSTANEVKLNCMRARLWNKQAQSLNHELMDMNRMEGVAKQGEHARNRKAFMINAR